MDALRRLRAGTVCFVSGATLASTLAAEAGSSQQSGPELQMLDWHMVVVGVVCLAVILVYAVISCTDCYKSEVSTDCHPASASGAVKWGGAGGYSAAATSDVNDPVLTAGFTGEVVVPGDGANHPLPYALIPSQVPEAQGFRGYGPAENTSAPGLSGYGSTGVNQPYLAGYGSSGDGQVGYGCSGVPQPSLLGYGGSGGGQSGFGRPSLQQGSLAGYGAPGEGQQREGGGREGQGGGTEQSQWWNAGGGSSRPLPGAHVPLMPSEPQEPPPPYFAASYQR